MEKFRFLILAKIRRSGEAMATAVVTALLIARTPSAVQERNRLRKQIETTMSLSEVIRISSHENAARFRIS